MTAGFAGPGFCVWLIILTGLVALAGAPAKPSPATVPASQPTTRESSELLLRELDAVINEMLADSSYRAQFASTRSIAPDESRRDRVQREAEELLAAAENPAALMENRRAPALPRPFDDASNRQLIQRSRQVFQDFGMRYAEVLEYLLRRDREQPLSGVRLELLSRLSIGTLDRLVQAVSPPKK